MKFIYGSVFLALFFSACSQKVTVKAIVPAKVGDKDIKNVIVSKFKNDDILLQNNLRSNMSGVKFDGKKYFNIVNREDIDKLLNEQKLQDSGLVNNKGLDEYGLSDANSIIDGNVNSKSYNKGHFKVQKTDYNTCLQHKTTKDNKKYCAVYRKYTVPCQSHSYSVSANIKITRISNSDIIFSKSFVKSFSKDICSDSSETLASKQSIYEDLSNDISTEFVDMISPSYRYMSLILLDDEDIDYSDQEEKLLENGLKLIDMKDIQSANLLFRKLVNSTQYKSSTALYNLGVTYEYLGDLDSSLEVYQKAKNITLLNDMDENIIKAVARIKESIQNKKEANKQINN